MTKFDFRVMQSFLMMYNTLGSKVDVFCQDGLFSPKNGIKTDILAALIPEWLTLEQHGTYPMKHRPTSMLLLNIWVHNTSNEPLGNPLQNFINTVQKYWKIVVLWNMLSNLGIMISFQKILGHLVRLIAQDDLPPVIGHLCADCHRH